MKPILSFFLLLTLFACSNSKTELYTITDSFVSSLQNTYESYGILGGNKFKTLTSDSHYQVMPFGRLINVKILEAVEPEVYESLKEDVQSHYKNDPRVRDVYISNSGTVMIDCRN